MKTVFDLAAISIEAICDADRWTDLSDALVEYFGMRSAAIYRSPLPGQPVAAPHYSQLLLSPKAQRLINHFKKGGDETDQAVYRKLLDARPLQLMTELSFFGVVSEVDLPFCTERQILREDLGVQSRLAAVLNDAGPWRDVITLQAAQKPSEVDPSVFHEMNQLLPIFSKSTTTFRAFEVLKRQFGAALGALERLRFGAALVDASGQLLYENSYFKEVLATGDGIRKFRNGRLLVSDPRAAKHLEAALDVACRVFKDTAASVLPRICIPRKSGREPFFLKVHAVRDSAQETDFTSEFALLFLIDPTRSGSLSDAGILDLKLLTTAEANVCRLLLSGNTTRQISTKRDASLETTRSQIKSVLSKLRCRDRLHLYQVAFTTHLPVRNLQEPPGHR